MVPWSFCSSEVIYFSVSTLIEAGVLEKCFVCKNWHKRIPWIYQLPDLVNAMVPSLPWQPPMRTRNSYLRPIHLFVCPGNLLLTSTTPLPNMSHLILFLSVVFLHLKVFSTEFIIPPFSAPMSKLNILFHQCQCFFFMPSLPLALLSL